MPQKILIGDLVVGEQFLHCGDEYEVKRVCRDGQRWPSPRYYYIGPPGNPGEECRLLYTTEVEPLAPITIENGVIMLGQRVLAGQ